MIVCRDTHGDTAGALKMISVLRTLYKCLLAELDVDKAKKEDRLLPGGDLRLLDNQWARVAWRNSELARVPRELRLRSVVKRIACKHSLCSSPTISNVVLEPLGFSRVSN